MCTCCAGLEAAADESNTRRRTGVFPLASVLFCILRFSITSTFTSQLFLAKEKVTEFSDGVVDTAIRWLLLLHPRLHLYLQPDIDRDKGKLR